MRSDMDDRVAIEKVLKRCIDHLHPTEQISANIVKVFSNQLSKPGVNVDKSVKIGLTAKKKFVDSLPESFHSTIKKEVRTMADMQKGT